MSIGNAILVSLGSRGPNARADWDRVALLSQRQRQQFISFSIETELRHMWRDKGINIHGKRTIKRFINCLSLFLCISFLVLRFSLVTTEIKITGVPR